MEIVHPPHTRRANSPSEQAGRTGGHPVASATGANPAWPALPLEAWQGTRDTLQLWTQIVGKLRLARAPEQNHWWHTTLYVSARGLTISPVPDGADVFEVEFDFLDHHLRIATSRGDQRVFALAPMSVAAFYERTMATLRSVGIAIGIWPVPVELADPIPFEQDTRHASYDAEAATRFWRALLQADRVLKRYRGEFLGKSSPVHFFWGSFDLAITRFSGRRAPPFTGAAPNVHPHVMHEAYSHELLSAGFWPGDARYPHPAFYAYAVPEPAGFREAPVKSEGAFYSPDLGEFILPYDVVRRAEDPDAALLTFLESTYAAGATLGGWDRPALEERPVCDCTWPLRPTWSTDARAGHPPGKPTDEGSA